jgi:hypothetical protein
MWEPRRLITLWAFTTCYRDSFTFFNEEIQANWNRKPTANIDETITCRCRAWSNGEFEAEIIMPNFILQASVLYILRYYYHISAICICNCWTNSNLANRLTRWALVHSAIWSTVCCCLLHKYVTCYCYWWRHHFLFEKNLSTHNKFRTVLVIRVSAQHDTKSGNFQEQ